MPELITLAGDVIRETDQAWLIELYDGKEGWLPKSIGHVTVGGAVLAPPWKIGQEGWMTR